MKNTQVEPTGKWQIRRQAYRENLFSFFKHPAFWTFAFIWLAAALYIAIFSHVGIGDYLLFAAFILLFALLTIIFTAGIAKLPPIPTKYSRPRLWIQLGILLLFILFTGYRGMALQPLAPAGWQAPVLYPLLLVLEQLPGFLVNPLLYFILPLICLLATGARWSELGLGRGYRAWAITLLWCALPIILLTINVINGTIIPVAIKNELVSNFYYNGFFEEFLMRGALMSRLARLCGNGWAVVLSSLIFGLWHIGLQTMAVGNGNLLVGATTAILGQGVLGLGLAIIFLRTRNLLAPSIYHIINDTAGQFGVFF